MRTYLILHPPYIRTHTEAEMSDNSLFKLNPAHTSVRANHEWLVPSIVFARTFVLDIRPSDLLLESSCPCHLHKYFDLCIMVHNRDRYHCCYHPHIYQLSIMPFPLGNKNGFPMCGDDLTEEFTWVSVQTHD